MKCAWNQLLAILPPRLREETDKYGKNTLQEIRLRQGTSPTLILKDRTVSLQGVTVSDDLQFVINTASHYSPWAAATTAEGYITAAGGHRIGICGGCVIKQGSVTGFRHISSLCIRVARDFEGIAASVPGNAGSVLIVGPPGSGKTTLLRDLIRRISDMGTGSIAVVDEREELFPSGVGFYPGMATDILSGCGKPQGLLMALKTMGPGWIAVDEITAQADCDALTEASWCGVRLLATAHAYDKYDLLSRKIYGPLVSSGIFQTLLVLQRDKSFRMERII